MRRQIAWCLVALAACASPGKFVWMDDYVPDRRADGAYAIGVGDVLSVRVFNQEALSAAHERVRPDGMISLQLIQDVKAEGLTPDSLAEQVQARLKGYVNAPIVSVSVTEMHPLNVPVIGEVARPGQYPLERGSGIIEALASAGGLTQFAHRDRIFVLRREPSLVRIRTTFEALSRGEARSGAFRLQPGDSVVVE